MRTDLRSLNLFNIGDQVKWTNGPSFQGKVIGKVARSEHMDLAILDELKNQGYITPAYPKSVSHHFHRLIVAGKNKRIYFVVLGKAEKVKVKEGQCGRPDRRSGICGMAKGQR